MNNYNCKWTIIFALSWCCFGTSAWYGDREGMRVKCNARRILLRYLASCFTIHPTFWDSSLVKHPLPIALEQDGLLAARRTWRGKAPTECSILYRLNYSPCGGERWGIYLLPAFQRDPRCFCHTGDQRALSRSLKSLVSGGWWFMSLLNEMFVSSNVGNR